MFLPMSRSCRGAAALLVVLTGTAAAQPAPAPTLARGDPFLAPGWFRADSCRQPAAGQVTLRIAAVTLRLPEAQLRRVLPQQLRQVAMQQHQLVAAPPPPPAGCPEQPLPVLEALVAPADASGPQGYRLVQAPPRSTALPAQAEAVLALRRQGACRELEPGLLGCPGEERRRDAPTLQVLLLVASDAAQRQPSGAPLHGRCLPGTQGLRCTMQEEVDGGLRLEFPLAEASLSLGNLQRSLAAALQQWAAWRGSTPAATAPAPAAGPPPAVPRRARPAADRPSAAGRRAEKASPRPPR